MKLLKFLLVLVFAILIFSGALMISSQYNNDDDRKAGSAMGAEVVNDENMVKITASMWKYDPPHIEIKKGKLVILELTSLDRLHGFYIPEFDIRADVMPNKTIRVELIPEKIGSYPFLCDIFCGDGHGEMNGVIHVVD